MNEFSVNFTGDTRKRTTYSAYVIEQYILYFALKNFFRISRFNRSYIGPHLILVYLYIDLFYVFIIAGIDYSLIAIFVILLYYSYF